MSRQTGHMGSTRKRARTAFVAAAVGALLVSTFGFAEWLSSGTGEGRAQAGRAQTLTATPAQPTTQLYPGGQADVALVVSNPNPFSVAIRRIVGNGAITSDLPDCDAPSNVSFTDQTNLSLSVPASTSLDVSLSNAASMSQSATDACQGATFTIPVSINAPADPAPPPGDDSDADADGLSDSEEAAAGTDPEDADTDGDGLDDNVERNDDICGMSALDADTDDDGVPDGADFRDCAAGSFADSDFDGVQDGTETGVTEAVPAGTNENGFAFAGTAAGSFIPDADPSTTTDRAAADSDGDGVADGTEDANHNGRVDPDETDPNDASSF